MASICGVEGWLAKAVLLLLLTVVGPFAGAVVDLNVVLVLVGYMSGFVCEFVGWV